MTMEVKTHAKKCKWPESGVCTCDGYHTFEELYDHRITLFIALCRVLVRFLETDVDRELKKVWRSKAHADGSVFDGWFIMGIQKERGKQMSYHLPLSRWDETGFAETLDHAPEWDLHSSDDVLDRLAKL